MNEPQIPAVPREAPDLLARLLGQRRAFAAVAGRCSAAHAQLLRRIHDEKLYLPHAPSWEKFCGVHLAISRRHADRLISLLNRFGPIYFELSLLVGISPEEFLAIEPAVRDHSIVVNGEVVSLIPENAPKVLEALAHVLHKSRRRTRRDPPLPRPCKPASPISLAAAAPSPISSSPSTIPPSPGATANSSSKPLPNCA
jgi:hypothetical protein